MLLVRCIVLSLTWLARDHCTAAPVHHQHGDDTGHVADQVQGAALLPPVALSEGAQGNFDLFFPTLNVKVTINKMLNYNGPGPWRNSKSVL